MMNRSVEQKLLDLYVANVDIIGEGFPASVNDRRREFIEAFNLCSLPDSRDERYRFSDLRALFGRAWEHYFVPGSPGAEPADKASIQSVAPGDPGTKPPSAASGSDIPPKSPFEKGGLGENDVFAHDAHSFPPPDRCARCDEAFCAGMPAGRHTIRLCNGFSDGRLTALDSGVVYGSLRAAAAEYPDLIEKYYNTAADNRTAPVTALNSAFMQDGAFVYVPEGVALDEPLFVHHTYVAAGEDVMGFGRALLVFGARSRAHVQFVHRTCPHDGTAGYLADYVRETVLEEEADVRVTEAVLFGRGGHFVSGGYVRQAAGSRCESHLLDVGEGTARIDLATDLLGAHAESNLYGLYLHGGRERCDIDVRVAHHAPQGRSNELVKGVAAGEALGAFAGSIYVAPGAQRTDAFLQNRNLLLGNAAHVYTKPQLEIYADDVKCSHGATVGQLDDDAVYYMRQRGIGAEEARKLQLQGFVYDVLSHCPCAEFRDWMTALAGEKIEKM